MELEHTFTVPAGIDQAWTTLLDVERIAPCMPGATLESVEGDEFTGKVKVKVGPVTITYGGQARFSDRDDEAHTVVIEASGKEARGSGTAKANVHTRLEQLSDAETKVVVTTDLSITGKPAQFGRGVINDVGNKIIGQFASCLATRMAEPAGGPAESDGAEGAAAASGQDGAAAEGQASGAGAAAADGQTEGQAAAKAAAAPAWTPSTEPIDLFETAGMPVLKRLAPVLGGLVLLALIWRMLSRRRG